MPNGSNEKEKSLGFYAKQKTKTEKATKLRNLQSKYVRKRPIFPLAVIKACAKVIEAENDLKMF